MNSIKRGLVWIALIPVRFYQTFISPLKPPSCKYYPSCSNYAVGSFQEHGIFKGFLLSTWRLARCNPFSNGGVDYVPAPGSWKSKPYIPPSQEDLEKMWAQIDKKEETA